MPVANPLRAGTVREQLPSISTSEDIAEHRENGVNFGLLGEFAGVRALQPHRDKLRAVNDAIARTAESIATDSGVVEGSEQSIEIITASVTSSMAALNLIVDPPRPMEISPRNSKQEMPQLGRLLVESVASGKPLKVVVPCCPDTDQYILGSGVGEIAPKGIDYCVRLQGYLEALGVASVYDIQIADVEGLDPVLLEHTGETIDTHFAKTKETTSKAEALAIVKGLDDVATVGSMNGAFEAKGLSFLELRERAIASIAGSQNKKVKKVVSDLLAERVKLGNFDRFGAEARYDLVVTELAAYAAFGAMVNGEAIILSPDAKSAVPAYHYLSGDKKDYAHSPVFYAP